MVIDDINDKTYYYIYMITNLVNNKKYIGKRMCHCEISDDQYLGSGKVLKAAIEKYGKDKFSKDVLEICDNANHCNEREKYWIAFYNAVKDKTFYNIASGGEGGNTYSGLDENELERIKKIQSKKSSGKNNPRYGTTWSNETREKIIQAQKEYYKKTGLSPTSGKFGANNKLSKKITCIETNRIFYGIREASRVTGIPSPNIIRSLKSNGKYSAGKFNSMKLHWKYCA